MFHRNYFIVLMHLVILFSLSLFTLSNAHFVLRRATNLTTPSPHVQKNHYKMSGTFWQITDIHWDPNYSPVGNKLKKCHVDGQLGYFNGYLGNQMCEAPLVLVQSAIKAMKEIEPKPDFILWTGDSAPHVIPAYSLEDTLNNIRILTRELKKQFGEYIPIIPSLGNHDAPHDAFPGINTTFYTRYLTKGNWKSCLDSSAQVSFKIGGFYRRNFKSGLTVVSLNNNLYRTTHPLKDPPHDPAGQLRWLKLVLEERRLKHGKVIISSHVPPGFPDGYTGYSDMLKPFNDQLVDIFNEYSDVILGQVYGHHHKDSFRILTSNRGEHRNVAFIAPPVSPMWIAGPTARNPSLRLYKYNSSFITDYDQYHLNLTEANEKNDAMEKCLHTRNSDECGDLISPLWKLYYRATETFGVNNTSPDNMYSVYKKLKDNKKAFKSFQQINLASFGTIPCNDTCIETLLCAISNVKTDKFMSCLPSNRPSILTQILTSRPFSKKEDNPYRSHVIAGIIVLSTMTIIVLVIVFAVLICRGNILNPADIIYNNEERGDTRGYAPLLREPDDFFLADRT